MKRNIPIILTAAVLMFINSISYSQDHGFGIGIMIGEPTGLSAKYWLNEDNAVDFGLAYSFVRSNSALSLHADYLYHTFDLINSNYSMPVYFGYGVRLRLVHNADNALGARGVIGVCWMSNKSPFDVFLEVAPVFNLFPSTSLNLDAALGARYYLN